MPFVRGGDGGSGVAERDQHGGVTAGRATQQFPHLVPSHPAGVGGRHLGHDQIGGPVQLPPGEYTCQVTVLDPTSQKAAFWQAPVMLIP